MVETIEKAKEQLLGFWKELEKKKKIRLIVGIFLILVVLTGLIYTFTKTEYVILYKDLPMKDAGTITERLDEMEVDWKFGESETTILVSKEYKNKAMLELASEGLPKEGYSVLDALNESDWTMTEYEKKERVRYADESQLAATISQIEGIAEANVIVDMPEDTAFMNDDEVATSSVFVTLDGDSSLKNDKVVAIKTLVSSSFKNMEKENVNVIDDTGRSYGDDERDMGEYDLTDQLSVKQGFESKLNNSIKKFLENLFGLGNVDVRASVDMNFDSEITNIVEFTPPLEDSTEGLVRSMEKIEEHTINGADGSVVGTEPNTEDTTDYATEDGNVSKYDKASEVINYELNEINREIKKAPGGIESVTVGILINNEAIDGELTDDMRGEIEDLIHASTGINTEEVIVSTGDFNSIDDSDSDVDAEESSGIPLWAYILIAVALLGGAGVIVYRRRKSNEEEDELLVDEYDQDEYIEDIDFETEKSQYKSKIDDFVQKKPDAVAQLLRSWLNEE
ncbi:flagellar M-ring protein FliF [Clostridium sp. D2Q-14]|uniref:flagellar basal-body MS-ring/collar protein FliF n=1 Tax=Anaeromonas gelatinilytica TaxID=2683194 RepID=UPI00193C705A|nr:flagellar basal-body MS-ring/collar protein FliF [Anaeromonas gelatinilytica]MBS4536056.1 flagellar M-ring protein FliF [Anaeromonas gelatinilytica]